MNTCCVKGVAAYHEFACACLQCVLLCLMAHNNNNNYYYYYSCTAKHMNLAYTARHWEYYRTKQHLILPLNLIQYRQEDALGSESVTVCILKFTTKQQLVDNFSSG
jgi:hypothetical protein